MQFMDAVVLYGVGLISSGYSPSQPPWRVSGPRSTSAREPRSALPL